GLQALTQRDAKANQLARLLTLDAPRTDAPESLPGMTEAAISAVSAAAVKAVSPNPVSADASANEGNLPAIVHAAMRQQLAVVPQAREAILARVSAIKTRADARNYLLEVRDQTRGAKSAGGA